LRRDIGAVAVAGGCDEAMRLFPSAYVIVRQAISADRLDDLPSSQAL
jgi:hypothetical protein